MSKSDVLVENPAWKVAREALQTIEDGKPKQDKNEHPQNEQAGHQYMNQPPGFFTPPPPPRPAAYNYNNGYNYYPSPGFYGGYNQRPGPTYQYPPYNQQYDRQPPFGPPGYRPDNYPMYPPNQMRPPHMPRNENYRHIPPHQMPHQQQYDPSRPTEDKRNDVVYQGAEVHYEQTRNERHSTESQHDYENTDNSSNDFQSSAYPSPWQESSPANINQPVNQKRSYSEVIKGNQFQNKKKSPGGGFKMTFIHSSGTKKFKPAWQPVDSKPGDMEEKENSAKYDKDVNGQYDNNNERYERQEQVPSGDERQQKKSRDWPPSLKAYVKQSFDNCKSEIEKDNLEKHFKELLTRVLEDGTAYTIEWDKYPLPNMEELLEKKKPSKSWKRRSKSSSRSDSRSISRSRSRSPVNRRESRKERQFESMRGKPGRGRGKKQGRGRGRGQKVNKDVPKQSGKKWITPSPPSSPDAEDPEVLKRKQNRANRFYDTLKEVRDNGKKISSTLNVYSNPDDEEDFDWSQFHIVGTSQDLTKRYLRLTSAPDPAVVRPQKILEKSLEMVKQKWKTKADYHFTCEQLKAIRQDLTVQGIRNDFTVEVYEIHARIALEKGDREEFNQCQTCLKSLYKEGCNGHPDEFTAYKIIYDIYTDNYLDMSNCLVSLSAELKKSEAVKHALALRSAWVLCNYHYFFQLYLTAPNMSGYLIDLFAERVRKQALKIMFKSYRPSLPVKFIESELAFTEEGACMQWLKELGATFTKDSLSIDTKASAGIVNSS